PGGHRARPARLHRRAAPRAPLRHRHPQALRPRRLLLGRRAAVGRRRRHPCPPAAPGPAGAAGATAVRAGGVGLAFSLDAAPGRHYNPPRQPRRGPVMSLPATPDYFPYVFTEDAGLPRFLRVRAEGLPLKEAVWSGLAYLRKYRRARRSAPPEEVAYFDR